MAERKEKSFTKMKEIFDSLFMKIAQEKSIKKCYKSFEKVNLYRSESVTVPSFPSVNGRLRNLRLERLFLGKL